MSNLYVSKTLKKTTLKLTKEQTVKRKHSEKVIKILKWHCIFKQMYIGSFYLCLFYCCWSNCCTRNRHCPNVTSNTSYILYLPRNITNNQK